MGAAAGVGTSSAAADADPRAQNGGAGSSDVEPSSSEQSADTVIYVGPSDETDGEHPPVHIPSLSAVDNRCHPLNRLLHREPAGQSRSTPSSPQRSQAAALRAGPASKAAAKPNGSSSARSSPVRNHPRAGAGAGRERPEERWIDGPRVSKSRAHGARAAMLLAKQHQQQEDGGGGGGGGGGGPAGETWIDGPGMRPAAGGQQHANVYGFMDYHKKNMIKKWVEHQVYQVVTDKQNRRRETGTERGGSAFKTGGELGPRGRASGQEENGDEEPDPVVATRSAVDNSHRVGRGKFVATTVFAAKKNTYYHVFRSILSVIPFLV